MKKTALTALTAAALVAIVSTEAWAGCGACKAHAKKAETTVETAEHKALDTAGLKKLLEADEAVVVLDARTGKYDDGERIPGASALSPKAAETDIAKAIGKKDAKVITYCSNLKCGASAKLAKRLRSLGYSNVVEYPEGIAGWKEAGNKVEK